MTQAEMDLLVPLKIKEIEENCGVCVLFAVEAGSRAWGVASQNSDFDVRFVYKRPPEDYLRLDPLRDVIEIPIDQTWDIAGWDLMKALRLLQNSNPGLYDWIGSPICYYGSGFREKLVPLSELYFSKSRMLHHYYGIASKKCADIFCGAAASPKKYFYALRSVLACIWVDAFDAAPPVLFSELTSAVLPKEYLSALSFILDQKMHHPETAEIARLPVIDLFLQEKIKEYAQITERLPKAESAEWDKLNDFFIAEVL